MKRIVAILMTLIMVLGLSSVGVWAADSWSWKDSDRLQLGNQGLKCVTVNGVIYAIGGNTNGGNTANVLSFDPTTGRWSDKASYPTKIYGHTAEVVNGKIYVFGGRNTSNTITNSVQEYDPMTNTWAAKANMPTARQCLGSAVVDGKIFVIGGQTSNSSGSEVNTVEEYDPATNVWTAKASMPTARSWHNVVSINNKIYAIGGYNPTSGILDVVEEYDPATNIWTTKDKMPVPNYCSGSASINDKIYIIGGSNLNSKKTYEYDPASDAWTTKTDMPTGRGDLGITVVSEKIYVIGGRVNGGVTYVVEVYEPSTSSTDPGQSFDLTATGGNSVVDLSWGASSGADSYTVKRSLTAGGPYTVIADGLTETTYSDTDVVNGTTYYYVVTAFSAGGESANSNEASATPQASSTGTGKALLVITMTNGLEKEYDLQMSEVNSFVSWYDGKAAGNGQGYYTFNKNFNLGPFSNRMDYLTFDKIQNFEVMQYQ